MRKIFRWIVDHPKIVMTITLVLVVLSAIGMQFVQINYDMSQYLPEDSFALKGKDILAEEFDIEGMGALAVRDDILEVDALVKKIETIEGVDSVIWLGSSEDITKPMSFMNEESVNSFYKDGFFQIQVFFTESNDEASTVHAVKTIRELVGDKGYVGGPASTAYDWHTLAGGEVKTYYMVAIVVLYLILMYSLNSFWQPLLFFLSIGIAVLLNAGTNLIFGTISSTTNSIFAIIQLAVSMDYSIFLLHRYQAEKEVYGSGKEAMAEAAAKTFAAIAASATTTIGGFVSLVFMQYGFGKDLGLVMAKGVFFSLITVVTVLPLLLLHFEEFLEKHKLHLPRIPAKALAKKSLRHRWVIIVIAIILVIPAFRGSQSVKYYYATERGIDQNSPSIQDNNAIDSIFHDKNQLAMVLPKMDPVTEEALVEKLKNIDHVSNVMSLRSFVSGTIPDFMIPEDIHSRFQSEHSSLIQINLNLPIEGQVTEDTIEAIVRETKTVTESFNIAGEAAVFKEFHDITEKDFSRVSWISMGIIGLIIMLTFKSIFLPFLLVFVIEFAIWVNVSIPHFFNGDMSFISFIIIGAIQLGATVDYAILYTSMVQEYLPKEGGGIKTFVHALANILPSVMTSAFILFAGTFSIYAITHLKMTAEMTLLIGRGALISLLFVITLLPALFFVFKNVIYKTGIGWNVKKGEDDEKIN